MSYLLKSKILLGVMVVVAMFAFVGFTPKASADCTITATLRVGSTGAEVSCLQAKVGATADGSFGPLTKASVMAYQSNHGLSADGVVGPLSRAVLNANVAVSGNFPTGCTSASGFSSITGFSCASVNANTFAPSGCTNASGFSPVTGGACYAVNSFPSGCSSAVGYSPTTGFACNGAAAPIVSNPSVSGEGSMTLYSAPVSLTSNVGQSDMGDSIMAFGIKATGSNITVNRVNVSLASNTSALPWKYFTNLYLYNGSTLIGSIPVNSTTLTENAFGTNYTAIFGGLTALIAKDSTSYFTVKADIVGTIPATPTTYTVGLNDASTSQAIRGTDGSGLTEYLGVSSAYNRTVTFLGTSAGTLTVVTDGSNPLTNNVVTSATNTTSGVVGLVFDLQNTSKYDVTLKSLSATLGSNNSTISGYYLYDGATMIASVGNPGSTTLAFTNLPSNVIVSANSTKVMSIKFDVNAAGSGSQSVSVAGASQITAIDVNSSLVSPTGTATGNVQTLTSTGVVVNLVSANATSVASTTGVSGSATGTFVFTVKANGVNLAKLSANSTYLQATGTNIGDSAHVNYTVSPDTTVSDGSQVTVTYTTTKTTTAPGYVTFAITGLTFENAALNGTYSVNSGLDNFHATIWAN